MCIRDSRCTEPNCGAIVRPDVVLYEEGLDPDVISGAVNACLLYTSITAVPGKMCGLNGIFLFFTKKAPLKQGGGTRGQLSQV